MGRSSEFESLIAAARTELERWEPLAARQAAERARALAAGWGEPARVALAETLLARAALLTIAEPRTSSLPPGAQAHAAADSVLGAAVERLEVEAAVADADPARLPALPPLAPGDPADRYASLALASILRLEDGRRHPESTMRGTGTAGVTAFGWERLLDVLDAEAAGGSGVGALDSVIEQAERGGHRALLVSALTLRSILCERRGAAIEVDSCRDRIRRLLESWTLTLPALDALSAVRRPDRQRFGRSRATANAGDRSASSAATNLTDVALALAGERDTERLVDLALDAAIALTGAERGILLLGGDGHGHHVAATRYVDAAAASELIGVSSSIARRALRDAEVVASNDVKRDPRFSECASVGLEITSVLCVPIHARAAVEGALYLDRRGPGHPFEADVIALARAVGGMLAAALLNARTIASLETRGRELEAAREELAEALATRTAERDDIGRRLARVEGVPAAGAVAITGGSPPMLRLRRAIQSLGASDAPVLISGETGSGKELVARAIHAASARRDRPFVAVNCGSLSESLLAAELFGSARGAFTGATVARPGLFVVADGGTLLLDEVGDMPPAMQTALLRVLESSEVRPVGSAQSRKVDVRVVAASHHDLLELVRRNTFRDDLRYRLEVVRIEVPPLRERLEDLPELSERLLEEVRRRYALPDRRLSPAALAVLSARSFPGNVRELRHTLAGAALAAAGPLIEPLDLPAERSASLPIQPGADDSDDGHAARAISIRRALQATGGHRGRAAKLLGIARSSLYRYCDAYAISLVESSAEAGDEQDG